MKYFVANWKANKNLQESQTWIDQFLKLYQPKEDKIVIICPPFPFLTNLKQKTNQIKNLKLGSQDISSFEEGAYTGEITAKSLVGLVDYVIVGHSERRKYFNENNETVTKKIILAKKCQIEPILCIRDENDWLTESEVKIIAYEPVYAIGSGNNEPIEKVIEIKEKIKLSPDCVYLYGGSVNENNAKDDIQSDKIDGLLIGGASLDPHNFYKIISQS